MCNAPMAMAGASLAIGAAGAVSKYAAAGQDAAAATAWQAQQAQLAEIARDDQWNQIGKRQMQEVDSASNALFDNSIRAIRARSAAEVSAGENGVAGNSVEAVARNFYREQGRIDTANIRNTEMSVQQLQDEKRAAETARATRSSFAPVRQPSMLGLGLEIAGAGVGAYDLYSRYGNSKSKG